MKDKLVPTDYDHYEELFVVSSVISTWFQQIFFLGDNLLVVAIRRAPFGIKLLERSYTGRKASSCSVT